jgi:hypothetical protein
MLLVMRVLSIVPLNFKVSRNHTHPHQCFFTPDSGPVLGLVPDPPIL